MDIFTNWHTWAETEPELRRRVPAAGDAVAAAVGFAVRYHGDQRRPTGTPYLEHLLEAVEILVRGPGVTDPEILGAAVLHDVVEDTPATLDDVRERFGDRVADMVGWVTKPEPADGAGGDGSPEAKAAAKAAAKTAYLAGLRDAPEDAITVKLADRASNVQTLRNLGLARQREYYAQTVAYIMPLAASRAWWADWYSDWQEAHRDLG